MSFKVPSPVPYPAISRNLHWLMVIFILFMFASGWLREFVPGEYRAAWMNIHKGCGITILALLMLRIAARVILTIPPLMDKAADKVFMLKEIHEVAAYAFAGLVSVHILATLFHAFYLRDDIIYRMIGKRKSANS